jgi:glucose-1-phosphate cytidylyltransferase
MKAFILCGGQGTRLREHTETKPKPMVEVGGRPILWHIMKTYAHHGIRDFVLCLGYKGEVIRDYFLNYEARSCDVTVTLGRMGSIQVHDDRHDEDGWRITLADTGPNTLTGGRIARAAARHLAPDDTEFCITYGDGVIDADLTRIIDFHRRHKGIATVTAVRPPSRFGELRADSGGRAMRFEEKPQVSSGLINGGYLVVRREFLKYISTDEKCSLESDGLEACAADGQLFVYEHTGYWQCMDTHRDWMHLEEAWTRGEAPWAVWSARGGPDR